MDTFLSQIIDSKNKSGSIELYNSEFFSKYLDIKKVQKLFIIKGKYIALINCLKARYDSDLLESVRNNTFQLNNVEKDIDINFSILKDLEFKREKISRELRELYSLEKYDAKRINELENELNDISFKKGDIHFKLKKQVDKRNSLLGQKNKNDLRLVQSDKKLKDSYKELIDEMSGVDLSNLDLFSCFDSDEIRSKYVEGLKEIIPNDALRKSYVEYFYSLIGRETNYIKSTVNLASVYVDRTKKEGKIYFPELDTQNKSIVNYDNALNQLGDEFTTSFNSFNEFELDPGVNLVVDSLNEVKPFVDSSLDYIDMSNGLNADKKTFRKLSDEYNKIYLKNEKAKPFLSRLFKTGKVSIKSYGYDPALHMFDFYIRGYRPFKEEKKKSTINKTDKITSKFRPIDKNIKKDVIKTTASEQIGLTSIEEQEEHESHIRL